jgi:hypothetical protein
VAHSDCHNRCQEHEIGILNAEPWLHRLCDAESDAYGKQCMNMGSGLKCRGLLSGLNGLSRDRFGRNILAGNDLDANVAGASHKLVHHRSMQDFKPA